MPPGHRIHVFKNRGTWVEGSAQMIFSALESGGENARIVLAGGVTPAAIYGQIASPVNRGRLLWKKMRYTFSDERSVPPDDDRSNYKMARETLLDPLGVPARRVLRLRGEDVAKGASVAHRRLLEWSQRVPLFDLVILGLGADGHVASLFPEDTWPDFGESLAAVTRHPDGEPRLTLTPRALVSTRFTVFLVSGEGKAEAVAAALTAETADTRHPSRMVVGEAEALWLLDAEAASRLPESWRENARTDAKGRPETEDPDDRA